MATTPTWTLPYPAPTDPPQGADQMRALALATDTAITTARNYPSLPWLSTTIVAVSGLANNTTAQAQFTITGQGSGALFTSPSPDSLVTARGGIYRVMGSVRTTSTTATAVDSWIQCYIQSPSGGATQFSCLTATYGASLTDVYVCGLLRWNAGVSLGLSIYNNAGDAENIGVTRMGFLWVAD